MNWSKIKVSLRRNLFALLDLFAQESDFVNGDRRKAIHEANQRRQQAKAKSVKDSSTHSGS
ncbi:hypothetical protein [Limosilactobacillus caecicola]|uniref:hypothetical protein n=1 Tax=Limosilactobacillus caecicola TaxID=2941332 RepID=UPI00203EDB7C|nr:hypothetical protein [Limosilactobacillus caecicola]